MGYVSRLTNLLSWRSGLGLLGLAAALVAAWSTGYAVEPGEEVDTALIVAVDVSHSVANERYRLQMERIAQENRPKLIVVGFSAYPRQFDFARVREIADSVGALVHADIAHPAGLVAAGLHPNPCPHADFVSSTTHKTLRGPRGGLVMGKEE